MEFTQARKIKKRLQRLKKPEELLQLQELPVLQPQTVQQPAPALNKEKKLDPDLEKYINNMKVNSQLKNILLFYMMRVIK